jgi:hypothetical protein
MSEECIVSTFRVEEKEGKEERKKPAEGGSKKRLCLLHANFCLVYFSILKMEAIFFPKHRLTFTLLHCILSQKIELLIAVAVRTSNPA